MSDFKKIRKPFGKLELLPDPLEQSVVKAGLALLVNVNSASKAQAVLHKICQEDTVQGHEG